MPFPRRNGSWRTALAVATSLRLLAACGGGGDNPATTQTTRPDAPTSTTTTATTAATTAPASTAPGATSTRPTERLTDASRLRLDGIGPITLNMTLDQASAAAGSPVRYTTPDIGTDCRFAEVEGGPVGLSFMVLGGHIVRVDVAGQPRPSPIATVSGIRVGSTEQEVMAAYPDAIEVTPHPYVETGHYLTYTSPDPTYGLIFETDGQRVTSFRSGLAGSVQAIEGCA